MPSFITRRLLLIIPTVFFALSFLFFLFFALPGDPVNLIAGGADRNPNPITIQQVTERYGFDDPLIVQFGNYWQRTIHWDLGESFQTSRSVNDVLGERSINSLRLAIWAIIIEIVVGIAVGLLSAIRRYSVVRQAHHDLHGGRVRAPGVRAGLHRPIWVRGVPEPARLAGVGARCARRASGPTRGRSSSSPPGSSGAT